MEKRLLVADDNEHFARLVAFAADRNGWTSSIYPNGRALIMALREMTGPALLILDVLMPELDGIETLDRLSILPIRDDLRIIFASGGDHTNVDAACQISQAKSLDVGAAIYKPVTLAEIEVLLQAESLVMERKFGDLD
ncbi:response regulator [bacterium]|nr:response regulator [bacterium]